MASLSNTEIAMLIMTAINLVNIGICIGLLISNKDNEL